MSSENEDRFPEILRSVQENLDGRNPGGVREALDDVPPADIAGVLNELDEDDQAMMFRALDVETGALVLAELEPTTVQSIAEGAPLRVQEAVGRMEPDEVVDVLDALPDEQAEAILGEFTREQADDAEHLLTYESDTAGGLMTTRFVLLPEQVSAREAIEITQRSRESETVGDLFVADQSNVLVGHLPLERLVFAAPDRPVRDLMEEDPYSVLADTDQEEIVRAATDYDLEAVPVIDEAGRMIGVVTVDDILEAARQEADEDIYMLAGTGERDPVHASVARSTRLRLPWLLLSVMDGMFIALLVSRFQDTLRVVELSFFIPLIPLMGGQVAIQSSAIMVRGLAVGSIRKSRIMRFISKQFVIALLLGLCCAAATGLLGSLLVGSGVRVMVAVALAVAIAIVVSGTLGMIFPLVFNAVGIDPAVSSGPFITMLNDAFCICVYLLLGTVLAPG